MDFEGIVYRVLEPVKGTSARGEWTKQEVVFELPGEFSRKLCVSFWGDKAQEAAGLTPGENVTVSINLESREYNGRWFTEARAWRITRPQPAAAPAPVAAPADFAAPMPSASEAAFEPVGGDDSVDDLPF